MASFDGPDPADVRFNKWERALNANKLPDFVLARLNQAKTGTAPWLSTMTPAELLLAKTHGIRPLATVSGTCWYHYGWSWTEGHAEGWNMALRRIRQEAVACGANAVVDVHMRTIARGENDSMDFTLLGTAVRFASLPPASEPIVATVPALWTSKRSPARNRSQPSAIWLRAELWVHRNRTRDVIEHYLAIHRPPQRRKG